MPPNIQITHDTDKNHARSESAILVNPNNPDQVVAASKKFRSILTYDYALATSYSPDGGYTWKASGEVDLGSWTLLGDPALAWDDQNHVYLIGNPASPPEFDWGIAVWKSTNGGKTWGAPKLIHTSIDDDKPWTAGDANRNSPFAGRVYVVWDDGSGMAFARTLDHGMTWIGAGTDPAGTSISPTSFSPEINVADDGTVYIVWIVDDTINLLVSTDGGDTFQPRHYAATGIITLSSALHATNGRYHFPGATFRVLTVPTACVFGTRVVVAWDDYREHVSRIYYAVSDDGGHHWSTGKKGKPLYPTNTVPSTFQHFFPQIVVEPGGIIGCAFYEYGPKFVPRKNGPPIQKPAIDVLLATSSDDGASFSPRLVTDRPWDPTVDAPQADVAGVTFIGDYFGIDASSRGFLPCWTDTRTGIQELWTDVIPARSRTIPRYDIVATIIDGIIQDGGGDEIVGNHVVHIDPWGPPELDILAGVAAHKLASMVEAPEGRALGAAAMQLVARVAAREAARLGGTSAAHGAEEGDVAESGAEEEE